ncbi:MAG: hypothetical protein MUE50_07840 [Pirellulaceae bacterium]|jgi:hypothetical protein|nr:hypothetical protein [Pirellulaceae bacterium]MCU0978065.1 hypothetical protein [Pirellulaceae bacterium]
MADKTNDLPGSHSPSRLSRQNGQATAPILRRNPEGLRLLVDAYHYAVDVSRGVWDFAVEIETLRQAGWTNNEFRWLVCRGFVLHAIETTLASDETRSFRQPRRAPGLLFADKTCFVLTEAGLQFASRALQNPCAPRGEPSLGPVASEASPAPNGPRPKWDPERQELRVGDLVVKQFKVPAANQERILAAFEEDGWPIRIDDPLPPASDQDPKRRLHDTINSLNRNQKRHLLRFLGDGTGQGIRWELVETPQ